MAPSQGLSLNRGSIARSESKSESRVWGQREFGGIGRSGIALAPANLELFFDIGLDLATV